MTPYDLLVTGTRNVGTYFANEDSFGTVAPGQRADRRLEAVAAGYAAPNS